MPEIVTIGSALVDIFIQSPDFQLQNTEQGVILCQKYGDKVEVDSFQVVGGGGGGNTAVGFTRMGFNTAVVAEMGRDSVAQLVMTELQQEGVETQLLIQERKEQTGGSVILVGPDGGRTVMVHRGAASELDVHDIPFDQLGQTRWIHLSSIGGKLDILQQLFAQVRQQQLGLSWNPGKAELRLIAEGHLPEMAAQILLLNQEEWELVSSHHDQLIRSIPLIVITQGKSGGRVIERGQEMVYEAVTTQSVDDTGAGDAFGVGFVSAHLLGKSTQEATSWGSRNAAAVVQHVGAKHGLLRRAELETM